MKYQITLWFVVIVVAHNCVCFSLIPIKKSYTKQLSSRVNSKFTRVDFKIHCEKAIKNDNFPSNDSSKSSVDNIFSIDDQLSSISLIAGTTIGAGILGLPSFSLETGFIPSSLALFFSWIYMVTTGLLIAETAIFLNENCETNEEIISSIVTEKCQQQNGLIAMLEKTLGTNAKLFSGFLYIFIHYSLLVAYIAEAGRVLNETVFSSLLTNLSWSSGVGQVVFTTFLGFLFSFTSTSVVEKVNNFFVFIILMSFSSLIFTGLPLVFQNINMNLSHLTEMPLFHQDYAQLLPALPIMLLSLVYHNIVPTVCYELKYNKKRISSAIVIGTLIPLVMFVLWNLLILGLLPAAVPETPTVVSNIIQQSATSSSSNRAMIDPVNVLITSYNSFQVQSSSSSSMLQADNNYLINIFSSIQNVFTIPSLISIFSEAAVVTSFIGFVFGLKDFFMDSFPKFFPRTPTISLSAYALDSNNENKELAYSTAVTEKLSEKKAVSKAFAMSSNTDLLLYSLILVPPLAISLTFPDVFTEALSFAGTYGIAVLFCIIPAAMTLSIRKSESIASATSTIKNIINPSVITDKDADIAMTSSNINKDLKSSSSYLVPGGNFSLYIVISFALFIIIYESLFK